MNLVRLGQVVRSIRKKTLLSSVETLQSGIVCDLRFAINHLNLELPKILKKLYNFHFEETHCLLTPNDPNQGKKL